MPTHLLPADFDLTATSDDGIDSERGQAIVAGDTYILDVVVLDKNGDPFDGTGWDIEATLRDAWVYDGGAVQAEFACVWTSAAIGQARISLTPAQTAALTVDGGRWDMQLVNVTAVGYDVGFTQTVLRGSWSILKDATRS